MAKKAQTSLQPQQAASPSPSTPYYLRPFPQVEERAVVPMSAALLDLIEEQGPATWDPYAKEKGGLNEFGFDRVYPQPPVASEHGNADFEAVLGQIRAHSEETLKKLQARDAAEQRAKRERAKPKLKCCHQVAECCCCAKQPHACCHASNATAEPAQPHVNAVPDTAKWVVVPKPAKVIMVPRKNDSDASSLVETEARYMHPSVAELERELNLTQAVLEKPEGFKPPVPTIARPIHFPGDGGEPLVCHTANELRRYLDFMGVDHDKESGVRLLATPYTTVGQERHNTKGHRYKGPLPDGFHYFVVQGNPDNFDHGRRCYDPELEYAPTLEEVGPDSQEVRWGCTPFRIFGLKLQEAVKCTVRVLGDSTFRRIEEEFIQRLSVEALRQLPQDFAPTLRAVVSEFFSANGTGPVKYGVSVDTQKQQTLVECFSTHQRPLMCATPMFGSVGMLGNGVRDHASPWIENRHHVVKTCHVPDACMRLSAEYLNGFSLRVYQKMRRDLADIWTPSWLHQCRVGEGYRGRWYKDGAGSGNSRVYSACLLKGLRHLCQDLPECCPSTSIHMACLKDMSSDKCGQVCTDDVGRPVQKPELPNEELLAEQ